jgi:hypothetical protein
MTTNQITLIEETILSNPNLGSTEIGLQLNVTRFAVAGIKARLTRKENRENPLNFILKDLSIEKARTKRQDKVIKELNRIKVGKTTFHHENSEKKEIIYRDNVIEEIKKSTLRSGDIYGLSAERFLTEKRIYNEVSDKFNFFSCENDDDVLYELYGNLAKEKFKMTVYNKNLSEVLSKLPENSMAHLIADYCGQLHSYYMEIADAVKRNIIMV